MGLTYSEELELWRSSLSCLSHLVPQKKKIKPKKGGSSSIVYIFI